MLEVVTPIYLRPKLFHKQLNLRVIFSLFTQFVITYQFIRNNGRLYFNGSLQKVQSKFSSWFFTLPKIVA